jgi:Bacterial mobilisation protein (MobC)
MPRSPRRPGRPPLPAGRRRRHRLTLCLTLAERDTLRRRAALARLPVGAYARDQSLRRIPSLRAVPVVNIRSVGQLGRLANNLNQLTKLAHQGRTSPALLPCLELLLAEISTLRRLLIGLPPRDRDKGAEP